MFNGWRGNLSLYAVKYKRAGEMLVEAIMKSRKDHDSPYLSLNLPMLMKTRMHFDIQQRGCKLAGLGNLRAETGQQ